MNPIAQSLNQVIEKGNPYLMEMLSDVGKNLFFPKGILSQSAEAKEKAQSKKRSDGSPVHSFQSLLHNLATIVRNTCESQDAEAGTPSFTIDTQPTLNQRKAFQLLKAIRM